MFLIISPLIIDHTRTETKIFEHTLTIRTHTNIRKIEENTSKIY